VGLPVVVELTVHERVAVVDGVPVVDFVAVRVEDIVRLPVEVILVVRLAVVVVLGEELCVPVRVPV
jgi:hypothetical protein